MKEDFSIAIATSENNMPNVRMVSYIFDSGKVYFFTFKGTKKTIELITNSAIAFTTLPQNSMSFVRSVDAKCSVSSLSILDVKDKFIEKYSDMQNIFDMGTERFELYEITYNKAIVTKTMGQTETITL